MHPYCCMDILLHTAAYCCSGYSWRACLMSGCLMLLWASPRASLSALVAPAVDVPGGTEPGCLCAHCPSASQGKGSSPKVAGAPSHVPSEGRASERRTAAFHSAGGERTGTQLHTLYKSHKPFYPAFSSHFFTLWL